MPVSIVVGGQFGSEGKGKVALEIVRRATQPATVIRVGGPNSGHTAYDREGNRHALRQMPAGSIDRNVDVVFPAGAYLDVALLLREIAELNYPRDRILVSPYARVILSEHKQWEVEAGLVEGIGSTGSGVGAAVLASVARDASNLRLPSVFAAEISSLQTFLADTVLECRNQLNDGRRVVIEGTQGFGLSLLEGGYWPKATSRSTTAAGALSEAGLSPRDVDDITLVIRSFPIRVAGNSGPLSQETTWDDIRRLTGRVDDLREFTTVTHRLRRVGHFDTELVRRAIESNAPTRIVLNHLDYLGENLSDPAVADFVDRQEKLLNTPVDWLGFSPLSVVERRVLAS